MHAVASRSRGAVDSDLRRLLDATHESLRPLRESRSFRVIAATRRADGARVTLVTPGAGVSADAARPSLERLAEAHSRIDHPRVPRTVGVSNGPLPWVELDCAAVADGFELSRRVAATGRRLSYTMADSLIVGLREAAEAAHASPAGPFFLGRMSAGNVLFDARGHSYLIGFGANVVTNDVNGVADLEVRSSQAPEVAWGAAPTGMADYVAILQFARDSLQSVEMHPLFERIFQGASTLADQPVVQLIHWIESRIVGDAPGRRPTLADALARTQTIRDLLGIRLDHEALRAFVEGILADPAPSAVARAIAVAADGAWVQAPGAPRRRLGGAQRRIVVTLLERHTRGNDAPIRTAELLAIGWPGDSPEHEVGANRVHAALSRLRRMALGEALERFDDGYRLAPSASFRQER